MMDVLGGKIMKTFVALTPQPCTYLMDYGKGKKQ